MSTLNPSDKPKTPPGVGCSALLGRCVEAGDDDEGQPRILIHTTREELTKGRNIVFQDCAVLRADELATAEVVAFDGQALTITLRFDLMPCAAIGEKWLVPANEKVSQDAGRKDK